MDSRDEESKLSNESSRWPISEILSWGSFGQRTPAERRFRVRTGFAAAAGMVYVLSAVVVKVLRAPNLSLVRGMAFLLPILLSYLAWESRRYTATLDELTRRIKTEAEASAYRTGLILAAWLWAIASILSGWPSFPRAFVTVPILGFSHSNSSAPFISISYRGGTDAE